MIRRNMKCANDTKLQFFTNNMTINIYMFCAFVKDWIGCNMQCSLTVTVQQGHLKRNKKILQQGT